MRDGLLRGLCRKEIARELRLSVNTVGTHTKAVYRLYGVGGQLELVLLMGAAGCPGRRGRRAAARYVPGRDANRARWPKGRGGP